MNRGNVFYTRFLNRLDDREYREDELRDATAAFRRASEMNPAMLAPHWNRGNVNERAADFLIQENKPALPQIDEALDAYSKADALAPAFRDLKFRIARMRVRKVQAGSKDPEDIARAHEALRQILDREPQKAAALVERGKLNILTAKYADALTDLQQAVAIDPRCEAEAKPLIEECRRAMQNEH